MQYNVCLIMVSIEDLLGENQCFKFSSISNISILYYIYICVISYLDIEKVFDSVERRVSKLALRKKGILEVICQSMMTLYEGAKTIV